MFVDGFLDLYRSGVLRRRVYADVRIQRLLNDGTVGERVDEAFLGALANAVFASPISFADFAILQDIGVFRRDCRYREGRIENSEGQVTAAALDTPESRRGLLALCTGRQLCGGTLLHDSFFFCPPPLYTPLHD